MKASPFLLAAGLFTSAAAFAANEQKPAAPAVPANYPLKTCLVSDEKFDHDGKPFAYTYKQAGHPDRVLLFCCEDCVKDFEKEPAKFVKKYDDAVAAQAKQPAGKKA